MERGVLLAVWLVLAGTVPASSWEIPSPFAEAQFARGMPLRSDIRISQPGLGTEARFHEVAFRDESFRTPFWYSVRAGAWLGSRSWFGFAAEFIHPKLHARRGEVRRLSGTWRGEPVDAPVAVSSRIQQFSISHGANLLCLDALVRRPLGDGVGLFGGAGLGTWIPHPEIRVDERKRKEDYQHGGLGWQVFGGVQYRFLPWVSAVAEYKHVRGTLNMKVSGGEAEVDARMHQFGAGLRIG